MATDDDYIEHVPLTRKQIRTLITDFKLEEIEGIDDISSGELELLATLKKALGE